MKCLKRFLPFFLLFGFVFVSLSLSENANAEAFNRTYDTAIVNFYTTQQINASVNLPWSANPGTNKIWLNSVYFNENSWLGYKISYLSGRMVMEIKPYTTNNFYVCGLDTQYGHSNGTITQCIGSVTVRYQDGTSTVMTDKTVYFNSTASPYRIMIYFDYQGETNSDKKVSFIQYEFKAKTGYDVISRNTNWTGGTLFELVEGRGTINVYETPPSGAEIANDLLQQQIGQNQTIINQNTQINQNIENINDTLTDSNVSGSFNTSPIQPFGPIGTITNSILELPRIILTVNNCQPLTPELPYVHENIEIPCPSTVLNQMAGDFMSYLDVIASAFVWFITARYIFKKVQGLRDPENDDEEYLDI